MSMSNKNWSDDGLSNGLMGLQIVKGCFEGLMMVEEVSIYMIFEIMQVVLFCGVCMGIDVFEIDGVFWRIFDFLFIDGKFYLDVEVKFGFLVVVIIESVVCFFFGMFYQVFGKEILVNDVVYWISGVVKDVFLMVLIVYVQIWVLYLLIYIMGGDNIWCDGIMGVMWVVILVCSFFDFEVICVECECCCLVYNVGLGDYFVFYCGQLDD